MAIAATSLCLGVTLSPSSLAFLAPETSSLARR